MALTTNPNISPSRYSTVSGAYRSVACTPNDTNFLADGSDKSYVVRAIVCQVSGNIQMQLAGDPNGTTITIPITAGNIYAYNPIRIYSTNTTATGIHLLL